jgi:hypothetical protein
MWLRLTGAEGEDQTLVETDLTTAPAD